MKYRRQAIRRRASADYLHVSARGWRRRRCPQRRITGFLSRNGHIGLIEIAPAPRYRAARYTPAYFDEENAASCADDDYFASARAWRAPLAGAGETAEITRRSRADGALTPAPASVFRPWRRRYKPRRRSRLKPEESFGAQTCAPMQRRRRRIYECHDTKIEMPKEKGMMRAGAWRASRDVGWRPLIEAR